MLNIKEQITSINNFISRMKRNDGYSKIHPISDDLDQWRSVGVFTGDQLMNWLENHERILFVYYRDSTQGLTQCLQEYNAVNGKIFENWKISNDLNYWQSMNIFSRGQLLEWLEQSRPQGYKEYINSITGDCEMPTETVVDGDYSSDSYVTTEMTVVTRLDGRKVWRLEPTGDDDVYSLDWRAGQSWTNIHASVTTEELVALREAINAVIGE